MNDKPAFGTKEWAEKNENLISGCSHDCKYCYAKSTAIQYKKRQRTTGRMKKSEIQIF
jgi:DNA repair photolyase